ncbi:hypothetical protein Taro_037495 [Colocasia esculenta]|uniref:Uncharacterized protein n=1 Tax=Colocasia esculenta TaxID=4460 RepID=A0A843WCZ9_COLES|nr:hypothetical protein [Colocasia esculenta]
MLIDRRAKGYRSLRLEGLSHLGCGALSTQGPRHCWLLGLLELGGIRLRDACGGYRVAAAMAVALPRRASQPHRWSP